VLTYCGVASCISCRGLASREVVEAFLGDISTKNFLSFLLVLGLLQSVRKSSNPSQRSLGGQVLKEDRTLVSLAENEEI